MILPETMRGDDVRNVRPNDERATIADCVRACVLPLVALG